MLTKWLFRALIAALALGQMTILASAQSNVVTEPSKATTANGNASSTVAVSDTFQQVWAAITLAGQSPKRRGCTIQNNGTHTMWVTEGIATASSTKALAVVLAPGQAYYCSLGDGVALQGEIALTGTATEAFYAAQY